MSDVRPPTTSSSRPSSRASNNLTRDNDKVLPMKEKQSTGTRSPSEANISVVVRCRDRNEREIQENSDVIVEIPEGGQLITVGARDSKEATSKTYRFDRVFGGGSGQQQVFDEIVKPMVKEV